MPINDQLSGSASPSELAIHAQTVEASGKPFSVLTINGGSSSIKLALYQVGELLERGLYGKVAHAIQQPALEIWRGKGANVRAAQQALLHRATRNRAARRGEYTAAMEKT